MPNELGLKQKLLKIRPHFILVFIPILFTLLFSFVMGPVYVQGIPLAIYDMDGSTESRAIIDSFYDCPTFDIDEDFKSTGEIEEAILFGDIKGALVIPENFGKEIHSKTGAEALMLIDGTNFLVGNNIQLYGNTILSMANASVQMKMLEAGGMVPYMAEQSVYTLNLADRVLYNPQLGYFYYLFAALLGLFVQQTMLAVTPSILMEEKHRLKNQTSMDGAGSEKFRISVVAKKIGVYAALNTLTVIICYLIAGWFFAYPINGNLFYLLLVHVVFLICCLGVSLVLATLFDDSTHCIQFVMFLAIPTILCSGYGWPEYMMAPGFAPVMKAVWPLYYYINPMKDLMLKGAGWDVIGHYVTGGLLFAAFWIPVGLILLNQKIKMLRSPDLAHH